MKSSAVQIGSFQSSSNAQPPLTSRRPRARRQPPSQHSLPALPAGACIDALSNPAIDGVIIGGVAVAHVAHRFNLPLQGAHQGSKGQGDLSICNLLQHCIVAPCMLQACSMQGPCLGPSSLLPTPRPRHSPAPPQRHGTP